MDKKIEEIKDLECKLVNKANMYLDMPVEKIDTHELGEIIDMVKDLAEAKEKCYKACYYKDIHEAMKEEKEEMKRYGYNPNRSSVTGRYISGYTPNPHMDGPFMMDNSYDMWGYTPSGAGNRSQSGSRMGYPDGGQGGSSGNSDGSRSQGGRSGYTPTSRYGRSYDDYKESRRYYTETKDPEKKREMERHADEHIHESLASIKEIFREADPEMKTRFKNEMTKAINEMN